MAQNCWSVIITYICIVGVEIQIFIPFSSQSSRYFGEEQQPMWVTISFMPLQIFSAQNQNNLMLIKM